jgi:phosphoribosylformimino-5-aminoimidazole carboxamide ribotide isomerase
MTDASFQILAGIDLLGGRVVRLRQGDFERPTQFSSDPVETAINLAEQGTGWLHVVDLDGARQGQPVQAELVKSIVKAVASKSACQVGGGLRSRAAVAAALGWGADRVVVGTAALADPTFAKDLVRSYGPESIVVAIDVRDGTALGDGWRDGTAGPASERVVHQLADVGVERFAVTAIDRDGLLEGPDVDLLRRVVALERGAIIASGGISSLDDLGTVRDLGCSGAIVGRAIYEGRIDLRAAVDAMRPGAVIDPT